MVLPDSSLNKASQRLPVSWKYSAHVFGRGYMYLLSFVFTYGVKKLKKTGYW